ncbi:MAG: AraC family transcriptional regulator [Chthoniobacter sp.]|jgi:AraC family transcriptional regulator|nr:AraC family transcriptional regulator [Chthoniobacter sp.]
MESAHALPPVDMETYVPAAITVVRRSVNWPGILVHERRGKAGQVNYPGGIRQHIFYLFLRGLRSDVRLGPKTKTMRYQAGEARFTPAGQPVAFRWTGEVQVLMLGFQPWFFERVAAALGTSTALPAETNNLKLAADHPACALTRQLRGELDAPAGAALAAEGLAQAIAVLLLREFNHIPPAKPVRPVPPRAVLKVVELMRQRLTDNLALEELAEVAGLSPFHFARQFKTATGHPPHDYLIRLRVDRAQELIRQNGREWTLAAIAHECGFADQSHMARHFKRVLGVKPGEFADAYSTGR